MAKFLDEHHEQVHDFVRYATRRQEDVASTRSDQRPSITVVQTSDQDMEDESANTCIERSSSSQELVTSVPLPELEPHLVLFLARSLVRMDKDMTDFLLHAKEEDRIGVAGQWNDLRQVLEEYLLLAETPAEKPQTRVIERLTKKFQFMRKLIPRSSRKNKSAGDIVAIVPKSTSRRPTIDSNTDRAAAPHATPTSLPAGPGNSNTNRRRATWMASRP